MTGLASTFIRKVKRPTGTGLWPSYLRLDDAIARNLPPLTDFGDQPLRPS